MTLPNEIGDDELKDEFVYFVLDKKNNAVKIGYSTNLWKRFTDLKTSSANKLEMLTYFRGTRETERAIHKILKNSRLHGEWFEMTKETSDLCDGISDHIEWDDEEPWDHFISPDDLQKIMADPDCGLSWEDILERDWIPG